MPSGIFAPAAKDIGDITDPAAMPAPADTRNERLLNIEVPLTLFRTAEYTSSRLGQSRRTHDASFSVTSPMQSASVRSSSSSFGGLSSTALTSGGASPVAERH